MKKYKLIPKIILWVLLLLGLAAVGLFFFGPDSKDSIDVAGESLSVPQFTDVLLYWNYALVSILVLVTLGFVIYKLVQTFRVDVKRGLTAIGVVIAAVGLCVLCWFLGSPEEVKILGYEGADNVGNMARLTDAIMYLVYILVGGTIVALVGGAVYTKFKK